MDELELDFFAEIACIKNVGNILLCLISQKNHGKAHLSKPHVIVFFLQLIRTPNSLKKIFYKIHVCFFVLHISFMGFS